MCVCVCECICVCRPLLLATTGLQPPPPRHHRSTPSHHIHNGDKINLLSLLSISACHSPPPLSLVLPCSFSPLLHCSYMHLSLKSSVCPASCHLLSLSPVFYCLTTMLQRARQEPPALSVSGFCTRQWRGKLLDTYWLP